jgi:tRNA G18 (ribose-2'-O)-methylase SpoU
LKSNNAISEDNPLRPGISKPARYVETIGKHKFIKLSSSRQHEYLALLAREALKNKDFAGFFKRYEEMQSWVELDSYNPPAYLTEEESIYEYLLFHNSFTGNPVDLEPDTSPGHHTELLTWEPGFEVTVVLDQVRSPYNTGSVLRLIDNFGFKGLVHNSDWLSLDHPQLCKAARGTQNWIPVEYKPDLSDWLKRLEIPVIGIEKSDKSIKLNQWKPVEPCVLLLGNEVYGIAKELRDHCDILLEIPMFGYKHSMNLNHALAIAGNKITVLK